jgi:hypothetical protein
MCGSHLSIAALDCLIAAAMCLTGVSNLPMFKQTAGVVLCQSAFVAQAVSSTLLNPCVMPATGRQTICTSGYTKSVRPSTTFTEIERSFVSSMLITILGMIKPMAVQSQIRPLSLITRWKYAPRSCPYLIGQRYSAPMRNCHDILEDH